MNEEFDALLKNGTWSLVVPSFSMNIFGSKWIFKTKKYANGSIEKYKARLVAKSFHQQPGATFPKSYYPVVKPITIITVLSISISSSWEHRQIDVSDAFLHGFIKEDVVGN
jgi:hypothetical protein